MLPACLCNAGSRGEDRVEGDNLGWFCDCALIGGSHVSMAATQANKVMEDHSQILMGPHGTFVGLYDGHGGPEAAWFLADHLFPTLEGCAQEAGGMSALVIKKAFHAAEEEFAGIVRKSWSAEPNIITVGSCCLLGVIHGNRLYVANLGDSRVILGSSSPSRARSQKGGIAAKRLCSEHNASQEEVRQELKSQHPDDSQIVVFRKGAWRVKGIIQVSRSIGDMYLKNPDFSPIASPSGSPVTVTRPVLTAEPSIHEYTLSSHDHFLIFASDGLWEHLADDEAVDIVHNSPRTGVAKKLMKAALMEATRKREVRYSDLGKIEAGVRRFLHDDISVVVVYLDFDSAKLTPSSSPITSSPWYKSGPGLGSPWSKIGGGGSSSPKIHAVGRIDAPRNIFPLLK